MKKYYFLKVRMIISGYEITVNSVHELPSVRYSIEKAAHNYIKNFWGEGTKEDNGYSFNGGEIFIRITETMQISEATYNTLKKFI